MEELKENQKALKLTSQKAQKQQHEKMQKAIRGTSTSSSSSDNETESRDAESPAGSSDTGGTSSLSSEESSGTEGLRDKQLRGIHLELERLRWHFVLTKLKCELEDKEKQRLHEEQMEQIRQQAGKGSVNEGLQNLLQPSNKYAFFLYCFIVFCVIHTLKELAFYVLETHYLFCFAIVLFYLLKMTFQDYRNNNKRP
ncbi:transmembrane protein 247-like [Neopsephotus bourkii]|uniref:transmembrane protein 247-like n=1 Tax=Neopsephotus bourkii TaxID=309878 RepID=UPI002AA52ADA|nr:transmembrane protein 247-like [Neopsephotus bourkii]